MPSYCSLRTPLCCLTTVIFFFPSPPLPKSNFFFPLTIPFGLPAEVPVSLLVGDSVSTPRFLPTSFLSREECSLLLPLVLGLIFRSVCRLPYWVNRRDRPVILPISFLILERGLTFFSLTLEFFAPPGFFPLPPRTSFYVSLTRGRTTSPVVEAQQVVARCVFHKYSHTDRDR